MKFASSWDNEMGLCMDAHGRVTWGMDHGWFRWAPYWFRSFLCSVCNCLACMIHGHDDFQVKYWQMEPEERWEEPRCSYCSTELPVDGKYVTSDQLIKPHWKDVPPVPGVDYPIDAADFYPIAEDAMIWTFDQPFIFIEEPVEDEPEASDDSSSNS